MVAPTLRPEPGQDDQADPDRLQRLQRLRTLPEYDETDDRADAGSRHIKVPNPATVSRRSAASSGA